MVDAADSLECYHARDPGGTDETLWVCYTAPATRLGVACTPPRIVIDTRSPPRPALYPR